MASGLSGINSLRDHGLPRARNQGTRFVQMHSGAHVGSRQAKDFLLRASVIEEHQRSLPRAHERLFGEGPGIAELIASAHGNRERPIVRSTGGVDDSDGAGVFALAVAGGENRDDLAGIRNGLGINHHDAGMKVAIPDHLRGTVWVRRPQMVVVHLAAVDIFPARIEKAAIRHGPRRVVLLVIAGDGADIPAVAIAPVQDGHLSQPAVHPALAAGGNESDIPVGQVGGLDVIVRPVGQLAQVGAIPGHFIKEIIFGAALAIGKEDLGSVIGNLRIPDPSFGVVQECRELAADQIPAVQLRPFAPGFAVRVVGVVAKIGIPMTIGVIHLAGCEDDLWHTRHGSCFELFQQRRSRWGQTGRRSNG